MKVEWIGKHGWTPGGVGYHEKGDIFDVSEELGNKLIKEKKAKPVTAKTKTKKEEVE